MISSPQIVFNIFDLRKYILDKRKEIMYEYIGKKICKNIYIPWVTNKDIRMLIPKISSKIFPEWKLVPKMIYIGEDFIIHIVYEHEKIEKYLN